MILGIKCLGQQLNKNNYGQYLLDLASGVKE